MLILLDPAHGHNTPGKRSPDGTLLEYAYTRDLANQILTTLQTKGHNAQLLVPEPEDIPLKERVRSANAICTAQDPTNVLLISIHVNAAGDGTRWHTATGWSCYTTKGHTLSDTLATCLYQSARRTFICVSLELGIPATVIQKITGHANEAAMRPYIAITDKTIHEAMGLFSKRGG